MTSTSIDPNAANLRSLHERFQRVRSFSEQLIAELHPEDCAVQSMPDASPVKWHLAHTTWFFETFLLKAHIAGYREFHPRYSYLFNSYYNAVGSRHPRPSRGLLTRPRFEEILEYRQFVDDAMQSLWDSPKLAQLRPTVEVGLHHEQQHQELMLTDIKHLFAQNPLRPAFADRRKTPPSKEPLPRLDWCDGPEGVVDVGFAANNGEFCYDNETPEHQVYLAPFQLSSRLISNGEYLEFIENGGYRRPELWLSDGWDAVQEYGWMAPLYWAQNDGAWTEFTLAGNLPLEERRPVCHLSFYEADAYARWAGVRLPTEAEWEVVARSISLHGNFVESAHWHPRPARKNPDERIQQMFGDVWEWTQSPYTAYPGYSPPFGALGEYNGKFMCNQMVLRGGSCATSQSHIRPSYRNFFKPEARWQFSGLRLARDA